MKEEDDKLKPQNDDCVCKSRAIDNTEKKVIQQEIQLVYEEVIQLEQALIELDEQNTLNAMEIRKREAKVFLLTKQIEDADEALQELPPDSQAQADQLNEELAELQQGIKGQKE